MDYTSGALRSVNQANFRPINNIPMAKGTRCNQLAQFLVFDVPFQMLSDNPTTYLKEKECADFMTKIPAAFDETVALDGKVAEYVALARRKGDIWFVGAMINWTARNLTLEFSFLPGGTYEAEIFKDSLNAHCDGTDYKKEVLTIASGAKLPVQLAGGVVGEPESKR